MIENSDLSFKRSYTCYTIQNERIKVIQNHDNNVKKKVLTLSDASYFSKNKTKTSKYHSKNCWKKTRYHINLFQNQIFFQNLIVIMSLFALFEKELSYNWLPKSVDKSFKIVMAIAFFIITLEFIFSLLSKKHYFLSFEFFVDFFSLLSLLTEVNLLWNYIVLLITGDQ